LGERAQRLEAIPGSVPNPARFPAGCKFHPRCARAKALAAECGSNDGKTVEITIEGERSRVMKTCVDNEPTLREIEPGHWAACHFVERFAESAVTAPRLDYKREIIAESALRL
jgi:hypothetical protein